MSVYSYPQSKIIDEVTFEKTASGGIRAYLHAREGVDLKEVSNVKESLQRSNLMLIPFVREGKSMLEVRGFKREGQLLQLLHLKPSAEKEKDAPISWKERFRKRTLQLTGATYLIGDIGLWNYGAREKDRLMQAGSFAYFLGTLSLVLFGRNDQSDIQVQDLAKDMKQFLTHEKVECSETSALHELTKERKKGWFQSIHEFCKRYPSELFNSTTALAGVFVAAAAYKNKVRFKFKPGADPIAIREMHHEGWMDVGLGTITAASGTLATLVKEKKPDPDEPPPKGLDWIWQKIRAHPLAISAAGYTVATLCHLGSTIKAYKEAKRVGDKERLGSVPFRGLFVGMALLSEGLLAISSKGHGEGVKSDDSVDRSVISVAAELITKQPSAQQEVLINHVARFLGRPDTLAIKDAGVKEVLRREVESMRNNPWATECASEKPAPEQTEKVMAELPKERFSGWQAKISQPSPAMQPAL